MNHRTCCFALAVVLTGAMNCFSLAAEEKTTVITTQTKTTSVITETVVQEKVKWSPFKIGVLDFTLIDIKGHERFLKGKNSPIIVPPQDTLNEADHESINSVMQGFVRMIDAWDNTKTQQGNRIAQTDDNLFSRKKALDLYRTVVKGTPRAAVIGADYFSAYLGKYNDVFGCIDTSLVGAAIQKLEKDPDFPKNFMLNLAKETGLTHLVYGTVSDLRTSTKSFKGYGIETNTTVYELDVMIKMVDLAAQRSVYSNVYTGTYREQRPVSEAALDNNIYHSLMKSALEQAAEDFYDKCRPGRKNQITVTPIPYTLTIVPTGEIAVTAQAEIYIDGKHVGNGKNSFLVPPGKHTVEIKAKGFKDQRFEIDLTADKTITTKLVK